jgi:hypothetical protein
MLPDVTLPVSLSALLAAFGPCFTAPTFRTFCALACGFLGQTGKRTVCGMLTGAGLSRIWPHDRAHFFFSRARWDPDDLGLAAARLVVALLVPAGQPVTVAIDDTLFRRRGKKVFILSPFGRSPGGWAVWRRGHVAGEGPARGAEPKSSIDKGISAGHVGATASGTSWTLLEITHLRRDEYLTNTSRQLHRGRPTGDLR